jgi:hypothetical protein
VVQIKKEEGRDWDLTKKLMTCRHKHLKRNVTYLDMRNQTVDMRGKELPCQLYYHLKPGNTGEKIKQM